MPDTTNASVLGIDPGRSKVGLAVVQSDGKVVYHAVVSLEELGRVLGTLYQQFHPQRLVVGSGTGLRMLQPLLHNILPDVPVEVMDEAYTSEEARRRYLLENPPRGWRRLIPRWLRTPEQPYDDYAAIILAERYWREAAQREVPS